MVIDKELIEKIIKDKKIPEADWLMNLKEYNYENFDISWLILCSNDLLKDVFRDDNVREKIKNIIEKEYILGNANQKIIDIYFRYIATDDFESY